MNVNSVPTGTVRSLGRCLLVLLLSLSGLSCAEAVPAQSEYVIGTVCTVNLYEKGTKAAYKEIFDRLREIEARMSANAEGTEVDAINKSAGVAPVAVHEDVRAVVKAALRFAELSGGALDPTVGPLVKLWNIGSDDPRVPSPAELKTALPLVNWKDVAVDDVAGTVFLKREGMKLDLGAMAKGYAADEVARIIAKHKIPRAIVDLGGNVMAVGEKQGGEPWRVGVQDPSSERGNHIGIVPVKNKTLVTSGIYERFFEADGKHYHHILSTRDGYPVENGLISVTIVADRSIDADCLSTATFALGLDAGMKLVQSLSGVEAIFIDSDFRVSLTPGLAGNFRLTDDRFVLKK